MQELINRVRDVPLSKIVMTANPDNPQSWFYRDYVANDKVEMLQHKLLWPDNPGLPDSAKRRLEMLSWGALARRRIYGEWAPLHGLIYTDYTIDAAPDKALAQQWYLSVDVADSGTTHALLIGNINT